MAGGVFSNIDKFLDNNINELSQSISTILSGQIGLITTSSITVYVVFYGYMVLAGKIQAPVEELVWTLAKFALLLTFIDNTGDWLNLVKEAIKGLASLGGSDGGLAFIDNQFKRVAELADKLGGDAKWGSGWAVSIIVWTGFILSCFPAAIIIVINKIMLYFLLSFLPLFIFCLMWGWLKESFNQYMSALLSNALVIIVITAVLRGVVDFFTNFAVSRGNPFLVAFAYLLTGLFGAFLVKFLAEQCNSLMKVSVEKIPTMKRFEAASYDNSSGVAESKKARAGRYAKNVAGSVYNRLKL